MEEETIINQNNYLTVIEHLHYLPKKIRGKALYYAYNSENYEFNKTYKVPTLKAALVLSFDFNNTLEPLEWWKIYDDIGNIEEQKFIEYPNSSR